MQVDISADLLNGKDWQKQINDGETEPEKENDRSKRMNKTPKCKGKKKRWVAIYITNISNNIKIL